MCHRWFPPRRLILAKPRARPQVAGTAQRRCRRSRRPIHPRAVHTRRCASRPPPAMRSASDTLHSWRRLHHCRGPRRTRSRRCRCARRRLERRRSSHTRDPLRAPDRACTAPRNTPPSRHDRRRPPRDRGLARSRSSCARSHGCKPRLWPVRTGRRSRRRRRDTLGPRQYSRATSASLRAHTRRRQPKRPAQAVC